LPNNNAKIPIAKILIIQSRSASIAPEITLSPIQESNKILLVDLIVV
jgi:hypothetical protein